MIGLQYCFDFCHSSTWINHRCIYVPPSWVSLPPPAHPHPLGYYRAPVWVPWVTQQIPTGYLTCVSVYVAMLLSPFVPPSPPYSSLSTSPLAPVSINLFSMSVSPLPGQILNHWTTREVLAMEFSTRTPFVTEVSLGWISLIIELF